MPAVVLRIGQADDLPRNQPCQGGGLQDDLADAPKKRLKQRRVMPPDHIGDEPKSYIRVGHQFGGRKCSSVGDDANADHGGGHQSAVRLRPPRILVRILEHGTSCGVGERALCTWRVPRHNTREEIRKRLGGDTRKGKGTRGDSAAGGLPTDWLLRPGASGRGPHGPAATGLPEREGLLRPGVWWGRGWDHRQGWDQEQESGWDQEQEWGWDQEQEWGWEQEQESGWEQEQESGRDQEQESARDQEQVSGRDQEQESARDQEQESGRPGAGDEGGDESGDDVLEELAGRIGLSATGGDVLGVLPGYGYAALDSEIPNLDSDDATLDSEIINLDSDNAT
ncbi:hypothetical protein EDC01DRAFT_781685, partial [Geopyxis carbonaria]